MKKPRITVIGGGTGIPVILRSLRHKDVDITAVVTVADDGGSSGNLRNIMKLTPPGDLRNVLVAMSDMPKLYERVFQYRFDQTDGALAGHPLGNLIIAGISEMQGSTYNAMQLLTKFFHVTGKIYPASETALTLHAVFQDGHEVAGEIAEIGENVDPKAYPIGKKIVANLIKKPCGKCYFCRHGMENLCKMADDIDDGYEIPGTAGLGEYIKLNLDQVYFMPDDMPTEKAVFAEPLGCVIQSVNQTTINLGDNVVVIGGGIMGQLHVMCAKARGAYVIMSEIDPERRKLAEELGCDLTFNPMEEDAVQFVKDHTDGMGAEAVFNTTAVAAVAEQAIKMTAPGGTVVMYSSVHAGKEVPLDVGYVHSKGVKITGTKSPSVRSFTESVNCLRKGIIDPSRLVSGVFTPEQCKEAFETALRPDTFRCIIEYK